MDFKALDNPIAQVSGLAVRSALLFAAKEDVRYYLNGVCIMPSEQGGALIVATDGHALICIRQPDGICTRKIIVPLKQSEHSRLLSAGTDLLVGEDGHARVIESITKVVRWISPQREIDGKFPDVTELLGNLSEYRSGMVGTFNPALLDKIKAASKGNKYAGVRFFHREDHNEENAPAVFTMKLHGNPAFGLVMPMRFGERENGLEAVIPVEFRRAA